LIPGATNKLKLHLRIYRLIGIAGVYNLACHCRGLRVAERTEKQNYENSSHLFPSLLI
jgi:uncharacterized membrane protein YuzA (DUF378 family)